VESGRKKERVKMPVNNGSSFRHYYCCSIF
jgi:hypothetical protein